MVHPEPSTLTRNRGDSVTSADASLSAVVYRSHAVGSLSPAQLDELTLAAQARNRCESITGLMVYTDNCFFQWLEGPSDSVDRVMHSIRNDARHTDIEILDSHLVDQRCFADWSMKLALPARDSVPWRSGILSPSPRIVDELRRHPDTAPAILLKMVPFQTNDPVAERVLHEAANQTPLKHRTATLLKGVIISTVIPELLRQHRRLGSRHAMSDAHPRTSELADLLVEPDQAAAFDLIRELHRGGHWRMPLVGTIIEPAARRLGDLWSEDFCTEFDVTLGLARLQTAVRLLAAEDEHPIPFDGLHPVVLIAPEPGELHRLGAVIDSDALSTAGWRPQVEMPADDKALQDLVSGSWFDVLDLSLSTAFRREHWLPRVRKTIRLARRASLNPGIMVLVGGRIFLEEKGALIATGADLASRTAVNVDNLILEKMLLRRGE